MLKEFKQAIDNASSVGTYDTGKKDMFLAGNQSATNPFTLGREDRSALVSDNLNQIC